MKERVLTLQFTDRYIPAGWKLVTVRDIADVKGGKRLPKGDKLLDIRTSYKYIRIIDFADGSVSLKNLKYINEKTYRRISNYTISSNDVYISIAGTIGLAGTIPKQLDGANLTENAAKLCNLKNVRKDFLAYYLNSSLSQNQIKSFVGKTSQPKLALFRIEKLKILLPSYKEQEKIVFIISKVDELIQKTDQIIEQTQRLKKGLMQKLFTTGADSTKSKVDFVTLGDYVEVKGRIGWRGLKRQEYIESGPYMISGYNLINRIIMWNKCLHISDFRYNESPEIQLKLNDVIMVKDGVTLGRVGFIDYLPGPTTINSTLVLIRDLSGKFYPEFLFYYFQGPIFQNIIKERVSGLAVPHIFQRDIKGLKIPILELVEQKRIASMLSQLDKYYEKYLEISNFNKNLKRGLMQILLTGKIRVKL